MRWTHVGHSNPNPMSGHVWERWRLDVFNHFSGVCRIHIRIYQTREDWVLVKMAVAECVMYARRLFKQNLAPAFSASVVFATDNFGTRVNGTHRCQPHRITGPCSVELSNSLLRFHCADRSSMESKMVGREAERSVVESNNRCRPTTTPRASSSLILCSVILPR